MNFCLHDCGRKKNLSMTLLGKSLLQWRKNISNKKTSFKIQCSDSWVDSSWNIRKFDVYKIFQFTQKENLHGGLDHVEQLSVSILCSCNTLMTRWLDHVWYILYIILYYTTKHFANYGFSHCFGFQYVPSRLPALGILAKILWEDLGCVFTATSDFWRVFVRLTSDTGVKRSLWWKVKQCQRKANGGRCVAGGKLMGNTSRQSKSGWRWILCWKGKQVVMSPFQNGNVNLPSINIRHGFGECTQLTGENWNLEDEFPFVKVQFSRVHVKGECETSKPTPDWEFLGWLTAMMAVPVRQPVQNQPQSCA